MQGGPLPGQNPRTGWQDDLLNGFRHEGATLELLCLDGRVLRGRLRNFDQYGLILETPDGTTLVYKHAVISVRRALGAAAEPRGPATPAGSVARAAGFVGGAAGGS